MPAKQSLISIVEDDPSVRRALRRLLQSAGYGVEAFASASEFLESPAARGASCLVVDIQLGDMTGFDLQERLVDSRTAIPIIFITAHDSAATRERATRSGAARYLRKPFEKRVLLDAIQRALAVAETERGVS
jgi:FixJ family two-component response regulator